MLTGGGALFAQGLRAVSGAVMLTGGGGCWGPWPDVLHPQVLLINHQSNVAQLPVGVVRAPSAGVN